MGYLEIRVATCSHSQMINITGQVRDIVSESGIMSGVCYIYIPHTTAGITINENADPDVVSDIIYETAKIVPWNNSYKHMEGNSAAHLKASMMGFSQAVFVDDGKLVLGTWQGIFLCEFDGPRNRRVLVKIIEG
ncbi:secondary thiamine-phosphate synthase enzyme YjbQ [Phosphitispora sp. TUW77]|uniref:secondary thiamine-phosphate synthase enzyme YjbQ n=1 Tax=Phosphitispora sp. TUW77 TaxID=3152361 RepID=UPI003AB68704